MESFDNIQYNGIIRIFLSGNKEDTKEGGLSGTYDVKIFVDDTKYETGIQITC